MDQPGLAHGVNHRHEVDQTEQTPGAEVGHLHEADLIDQIIIGIVLATASRNLDNIPLYSLPGTRTYLLEVDTEMVTATGLDEFTPNCLFLLDLSLHPLDLQAGKYASPHHLGIQGLSEILQ
jgi:hypothetical protein